MKTYLVGGAVRDKLLDIKNFDNDFVVVGATFDQMIDKGFQAVGKAFPVFLHPKTKEEYALARTERKNGKGYKGFECFFDASVTLEQDLKRRDLTINAMAETEDGVLIDPYGGQQDIQKKLLRHVSDAFVEDPVRLLRTARFAAKFASLGFSVAPETNTLMYEMVKRGEVDALVPERVWQETEKALRTDNPQVYFETLRQCGALERIFPELHCLFGMPATKFYHGEIDTGVHLMMVLKKAVEYSDSPYVKFGALMHDLGKGLTAFDKLPSHPEHAERGEPLVNALCDRLNVPNDYRSIGIISAKYHTKAHKCFKATAAELLTLLYDVQAFRFEERFKQFLQVCEADAFGRIAKPNATYKQAAFLMQIYDCAKSIDVQDIIAQGFKGSEIQMKLKQAQQSAIDKLIEERKR